MRQHSFSHRNQPGFAAGAFLLAFLGLALAPVGAADLPPTTRPAPQTAGDLFDGTAVWTVHLTFTPEQWAAIEPKGGVDFGAMFGGGGGPGGPRPGGPGGPGGAGGPGAGGPRPQAFGWSM